MDSGFGEVGELAVRGVSVFADADCARGADEVRGMRCVSVVEGECLGLGFGVGSFEIRAVEEGEREEGGECFSGFDNGSGAVGAGAVGARVGGVGWAMVGVAGVMLAL